MRKKIVGLLLAVVFFVCGFPLSGYAAKNSDITRVYKKIVTNTDFMQKLYAVVPLYSELGLTEELVTDRIKRLINDVVNTAVSEKASGVLTTENIEQRFKEILMTSVQYMEAEYLSLLLDAFPEETIEKMLEGVIPEEFRELYRLLAKEAYYILGYNERGIEIIFDDMTGYEWSFTAVDYLFNKDIISGTGDFVFDPGGYVTREQFVKMICSAFDSQIVPGDKPPVFSDVSLESWYYPYVTKLASAGLINGVSETVFGTGNNIKRQDMAVLMFRIGEDLGYFSPEMLKLPFNDQNDISSYALTAVNTLKNKGIINGDEGGNFNPHKGASRVEAAQMIYNFYIYVSNFNQ